MINKVKWGAVTLLPLSILVGAPGCHSETAKRSEAVEDSAMSIIGPGKKHYVTSSPFFGKVLNDSIPVANAKILRKVRSNESEDWVTEEFETNDLGEFKLPAREESYDLGLKQFVSATQVDIEIDGKMVNFWYSNNTRGELYSEFGGEQPEELVCELTQEEVAINGSGYGILAKCKWANMPEEEME